MGSDFAKRTVRAARATLGLLLAALVLAACAGTGAKSTSQAPATPRIDQSASQAMNVLIAAGLVKDATSGSVRDMPKGDMPQQAQQSGPGWVDVGWAASNAISPPVGIGGGAALGISAISLLLPDPVDPLTYSWVIAWMPKQEASTPGAAKARMRKILDDALLAALKSELPSRYQVAEKDDGLAGRINIGGGECDINKVYCMYSATVNVDPVNGTAPTLTGGGAAWVWPNRLRDNKGAAAAALYPAAFDRRQFYTTLLDILPDAKIYTAFSQRLPKWVYLYLAPGKVSLGPGKGFNKAPVVLNQGKPLYFVSR